MSTKEDLGASLGSPLISGPSQEELGPQMVLPEAERAPGAGPARPAASHPAASTLLTWPTELHSTPSQASQPLPDTEMAHYHLCFKGQRDLVQMRTW